MARNPRNQNVLPRQRMHLLLVCHSVLVAMLLPSGIVAAFTIGPPRALTAPTAIQHRQHPPNYSSSRMLFMNSGNENDDQAEWNALMAAFQMYKAAYGDLKVPLRFIVPSMAPWPETAWGVKLGKRVADIRTTGKFIENNDSRRRTLEEMGFVWRVRETAGKSLDGITFEQIYNALVIFKRLHPNNGVLDVPANFVVPNSAPWPESTRGLPLGRSLPNFTSPSFLKSNPKKALQLKQLGIAIAAPLSANDQRFQKVVDALTRYKEIYGDLLVPQPFAVPESNEWPTELWGLRLGARVNAIRSQGTFVNTSPERRDVLDELGFVWNPPPSQKKRGRKPKAQKEAEEQVAAAAAAAADTTTDSSLNSAIDSLFGSFDFAGLADDEGKSTAPTWSLDTDRALDGPNKLLEEMAPPVDEYKEPQSLAESLQQAVERAVEVGVIEPMEERKTMRKGKRKKDIPWFNDDFGDDFVFEDVVEALRIYKEAYGDFANLTKATDPGEAFIVPGPAEESDDDFGFDLYDADASTRAAAAIAAYERKNDPVESDDLVEAEMRRLKEEADDLDVQEREQEDAAKEVATASPLTPAEWPEHLAGMGLGNIVTRIRDGSLEVKHIPERKAQLDGLDFDWGDPKYFIDVPFEKAMCAMYAYYLVRGDMFVYDDFVMPDEDPWPQALAGYELGKAVTRIRELQHFLEAYHPEKVSLLRMIDFVWFPTLALPLDENEAEMTPEMQLLSAFGHPDYSKMIDIPMGLPDKIVADGPFFVTDDPKLWWRKWHNWDYVKDYWYQNGRRDNAFVLRGMGYPQMAEEHEAKYGPGLFQQIEETMDALEGGIEGLSIEEREGFLEKLTYFRQEMAGCTDIHPQDLKQLLEDLDMQILALMTDKDKRTPTEDDEDYEYEYVDVPVDEEYDEVEEEYLEDEDAYEEEYEEEEEVEVDFDIEDELGLGDTSEKSRGQR